MKYFFIIFFSLQILSINYYVLASASSAKATMKSKDFHAHDRRLLARVFQNLIQRQKEGEENPVEFIPGRTPKEVLACGLMITRPLTAPPTLTLYPCFQYTNPEDSSDKVRVFFSPITKRANCFRCDYHTAACQEYLEIIRSTHGEIDLCKAMTLAYKRIPTPSWCKAPVLYEMKGGSVPL